MGWGLSTFIVVSERLDLNDAYQTTHWKIPYVIHSKSDWYILTYFCVASKDKGCGSPRCGSRIVHGTNVNAGQYGHAHDSALSPEHVRTEKLNQGITSRTTRYPCGIQRLVSTHSNSYLSGRGGGSWLLKLKLKVPPTFHFRGGGILDYSKSKVLTNF